MIGHGHTLVEAARREGVAATLMGEGAAHRRRPRSRARSRRVDAGLVAQFLFALAHPSAAVPAHGGAAPVANRSRRGRGSRQSEEPVS
jgi:hypothetical protein